MGAGPAKDSKVPSDITQLYEELRTEIDFLAKAEPGKPTDATAYPDPAKLSPIERRLLVRSVFSFIEALVFCTKVLALESSRAAALSRGELAMAQDEDYEISDSGEVTTRPARLRFLSNLKFAFRLLAKVEGADYQLDISGSGWQALQRALKVRDRLMHPKAVGDLQVGDDEVRDALRAFIWFEDQAVLILEKVVQALHYQLARTKRQRKEPGS